MTNTDIATASHDALKALRWTIGEVATQPNGLPGYVVEQPFRVIGRGRKAKIAPAQTQRHTFDVDGSMIVEVL